MTCAISPRLWQPLARRLLPTSMAKVAPSALTAQRRLITTPCEHCGFRQPARTGSVRSTANFSTTAAFHARKRIEEQDGPQPADDPDFKSILDNPPELVRAGRRHGPGLIILAIIPITAFCLGTWQVYRLRWKTDLLAKCEDRLVQPPLPMLPSSVETAATAGNSKNAESEFDYRRVVVIGTFDHDQEMLVGPRIREGTSGYLVVTPLEVIDPNNPSGEKATILVNRGWISKEHRAKASRGPGGGRDPLPHGLVRVEGMLRTPWKKNMFTPENRPDKGEFYFPDVKQMAELTGSQPVWIQATMEPDLLQVYDMESHGVPVGNPAEVNLRNTHAQYIFTWYSLSLATTIMLWMVTKKPPSDVTRRVRMNKTW